MTVLGDVAELIRGVTFKPTQLLSGAEQGAVGCLRTKNVQAELDMSDLLHVPASVVKQSRQYLRPGDVVISSANSWNLIGKAAWAPEFSRAMTFGGFLTVLRATTDVVDARYLYRWFTSGAVQARVRSFAQRTTNIANLNLERTLGLDVPLPSLPEQRRIASILDEVDASRVLRRGALERAESLHDSLFSADLGSFGMNRRRFPRRPIAEIASTRLGKMLDASKQTGTRRRKYLRNANVQWMRFELNSLAEMDFSAKDEIEYELLSADVLVCEGGQPGRSAVWHGELEGVYFQKALHRVRLDPSVMLPDVFVRTMRGLVDSGELAESVSSATIAHLTGEKLKSLEIPVPPMSSQLVYAEKAAAIERLTAVERQHVTKLDELFASVQYRAFRDEL